MTPLELSILLHYRSLATDFKDGDLSAPATASAFSRFVTRGLLEVHDDYPEVNTQFQLTSKGRALIDSLCAFADSLESGIDLVISINTDIVPVASAELTVTMKHG